MDKRNLNNPTGSGKRGRMPAKSLFEDGTYDLDEFHDKFIEMEDPTEYKPALELVGTWLEWERLKRDWPAFNTYILAWKDELEVKLKSQAFARINKLASDEDHYQANKWMAEEGYHKKAGVGRPTKNAQKKAAEEIARAAAETKEEKQRIFKLVNSK